MLVIAQTTTTEENSNFLVSPNVGLMIWTLLAFLVAFFVLRKYPWPQIAAALDNRQQAVEASTDTADRRRAKAQELLEEAGARWREGRAQADEIVVRARKA